MKFMSMTGNLVEVSESSESFIDVIKTDKFDVQYYSYPTANSNISLPDILTMVFNQVAVCPLYIRRVDMCWVLAHIEDFKGFAEETADDIYGSFYGHDAIENKFSDYLRERPDADFIFVARTIYILELVHTQLYGGDINDYAFYSEDKAESSKSIGPLLIKGMCQSTLNSPKIEFVNFKFESLDFLYDRRFKTVMSQDYFCRRQGFFIIPVGEVLELDVDSSKYCLESGHVGHFTVERFYKTQSGWYEGHEIILYPVSKNIVQFSMDFDVILKCSIKIDGLGERVIAYIPLFWITHRFFPRECYKTDPSSIVPVDYNVPDVKINSEFVEKMTDISVKKDIEILRMEKSMREILSSMWGEK